MPQGSPPERRNFANKKKKEKACGKKKRALGTGCAPAERGGRCCSSSYECAADDGVVKPGGRVSIPRKYKRIQVMVLRFGGRTAWRDEVSLCEDSAEMGDWGERLRQDGRLPFFCARRSRLLVGRKLFKI
jgi:hypothetical protein